MKETYHFEKGNKNLDETIRLDMINEKVKELKQQTEQTQQPSLEDELGDANAFLDAFESESFALPEDTVCDDMKPAAHKPEASMETMEELPEETAALTKPLPRLDAISPNHEGRPEEWDEEDGRLFGMHKRNATLLALLAMLACFMGFVLVRYTIYPAVVYEKTAEVSLPVLIQEVLSNDSLRLYDVTAKTTIEVLLTENTTITDAMNRQLLPSDLQRGDLVMAVWDTDEKKLISVQYSNAIDTFEKTGLEIDTTTCRLKGREETFIYGEGAMFLYEEKPIASDSIEPCDILQLKSFGDTVWCIEVMEYHGFITVQNAGNIKNGTFQLGEDLPMPLQQVQKIPVRTGVHTVKITGDNIETKTETVLVEAGKEVFCDVSRAQEKMGVIIVNANVEEYRLYINGSVMENPAVLPFGEYEMVILKGGYEEWSQQVSLQQDSVIVQAELKEISQLKESESSKKEEFQYGTLTITANYDDAMVYINQEQYGIAPMEVNLPYSSYIIRLEKEGYAPYEKEITISEPTAALHAQLR